MGLAPDDLDIFEFAIRRGLNPQDVRDNWSLRDRLMIEMVEEAQRLAAPTIARLAAEELERKRGTADGDR